MTIGLDTLGMMLMILGWGIQLYYSAVRKIFALSLKFVAVYTLGCVLLVIDAGGTGSHRAWVLHLAAAAIAVLAGYFARKARP